MVQVKKLINIVSLLAVIDFIERDLAGIRYTVGQLITNKLPPNQWAIRR
jgi:hypothetical protein